MSKLREKDPIDFTVMAMEGLWVAESGEFEFGKMEPWLYTLMMMQPEHITQDMFQRAVSEANAKRPNPALGLLRLEVAVRPIDSDHAYRSLLGGAGHNREDGRLRRETWLPASWPPPRDLHGIPETGQTGESENDPQASDRC
ncbi:MAG: hypothetical protein V3S26_03620 [Acidimicrobiia bacterium]